MPSCRFCGLELAASILDLGASPLANAYIPPQRLNAPETYYPLTVFFCNGCGLAQLEEFSSPREIFGEYDYFSSFSRSWLDHARDYVEHMCADFHLSPRHTVVEIASNDGYLLQYFVEKGVRVLGVEPAENVARAAREKGVPTRSLFFSLETAGQLRREGYDADLIVGNNVLAHVPNINDFAAGIRELLKPDGIVTLEFPHLLRLAAENQFDTVYHEHFSYLSLFVVEQIFARHGLRIFDVRELPTHGGSLRIYAGHASGSGRPVSARVAAILEDEKTAHLDQLSGFAHLQANADRIKADLLEFLLQAKRENRTVLGYGAAAKGNTLLNYAGVKPDLLPLVADLNRHKQGKFLPGSRIPIVSPDELLRRRPDYVLILPWNLKKEIGDQLAPIRSWGGRFAAAIPGLAVF